MMRRWKLMVIGGVVGAAMGSGTVHGDMITSLHPEKPAGPWIRFGGERSRARALQRSEAGVTLAVTRHVALQLNYERTAMAPMMHADHDDGVLTRLRLSF